MPDMAGVVGLLLGDLTHFRHGRERIPYPANRQLRSNRPKPSAASFFFSFFQIRDDPAREGLPPGPRDKEEAKIRKKA
jgi:hypothetical protein